MHKKVAIGFVVSGLLVATLGNQAQAFHHRKAALAAAAACPCIIMEGGAGTRGVTTGYTIACMRSSAVRVGCHRWARACSLPGYACAGATRWSFYGCGGYGCHGGGYGCHGGGYGCHGGGYDCCGCHGGGYGYNGGYDSGYAVARRAPTQTAPAPVMVQRTYKQRLPVGYRRISFRR